MIEPSPKTADQTQNPIFEPHRIGTLRRELLDRILILNRRHLEHVLAEYTMHFNQHRPHRALQHAAPPGHSHRPRPSPTFASDVAIGSAG